MIVVADLPGFESVTWLSPAAAPSTIVSLGGHADYRSPLLARVSVLPIGVSIPIM